MDILKIVWKSINKKVYILALFFIIILGLSVTGSWMMEEVLLEQAIKLNLGLVNEDTSEDMEELLGLLFQSSEITDKFYVSEFSSEEELTTALKNKEVIGGVILPEDFLSSVIKGKNYTPKIILNNVTGLEQELLENFILTLEHLMDATQSGVYSIFANAREAGIYKSSMVYEANWSYIRRLLTREDTFQIMEIEYIDSVRILDFYVISFGIFLIILTTFLFYEDFNVKKDLHIYRQIHSVSNLGHLMYWMKLVLLSFIYTLLFLGLIRVLEGEINIKYFFYTFAGSGLMIGVQALLSFIIKDFSQGVMFNFIYHLTGLFSMGCIVPSLFLAPSIQILAYLSPMYYIQALLLSPFTLGGNAWGMFAMVLLLLVILGFFIEKNLIKQLKGNK